MVLTIPNCEPNDFGLDLCTRSNIRRRPYLGPTLL